MRAVVKPVRILIGCAVLVLSHFRDFSNFLRKFRRIPNLYYYTPQDGGFTISGSDQACFVCARPSGVPVGVRVISVPHCGPIV